MDDNAEKKIKANCPHCDDERNCEVHGTIDKQWGWEDRRNHHSMDGSDKHSLLECLGCETVFYQRISCNSEHIDHWIEEDGSTGAEYVKHFTTYPRPESKTKPVWVDLIHGTDLQLGSILDETYAAFDAEHLTLAAIGLRTAFDRASEVLEVDTSLSFVRKLAALQSDGMIGAKEREILEVVIDGGSAAAHRAHSFEQSELAQLFAAMEVFLQRAFIVGNKALELKNKIPPRS